MYDHYKNQLLNTTYRRYSEEYMKPTNMLCEQCTFAEC